MRYGPGQGIAEEIHDDWWANRTRQPIACFKTHAAYECYYVIRYRRRCWQDMLGTDEEPGTMVQALNDLFL
ncbi:hypothetical protein ElyMa_005515300 [Elysia marginata]|uniref:Uncharacterized protein n=1 Tax=Elysia marginata TaxID=1093978 RepID=A0AAV4EUU1_9GAST|nr:hypothetical protein ElyMa_005515300 [Elysia marginata]